MFYKNDTMPSLEVIILLGKEIKPNLPQKQRLLVIGIYLFILIVLFNLLGGNFRNMIWNSGIDSSIWFYSGALMIILGSYLVEPYFTKPSDAIVNSIAVLIALFGLTAKSEFVGYSILLYYSVAILFLGILVILLADVKNNFLSKVNKVLYFIIENLGKAKVMFSVVYLLAAYSYFANPEKIIIFVSVISLWICITFFDIVGIIVNKLTNLIEYFKTSDPKILGEAIGCDNPFLYKVEVDFTKHKFTPIKFGDLVVIERDSYGEGIIGIVTNIKQLLNKQWLSIYLIRDKQNEVLRIGIENKKLIPNKNTIFAKKNLVYLLSFEDLDSETQRQINESELYNNRNNFIGYVTDGSNINIINFAILEEMTKCFHSIAEGTILKSYIHDKETLYQVINGNTREERLEKHDNHGYLIGIARKLGQYDNETKELNISKWMPNMFTPVFFVNVGNYSPERMKEIAHSAIGRLPETDMEIQIKDIGSIVSHNTAILGILGIGKSCLAFELIKKIIDNNIKIICIDITNQYFNSDNGLKKYVLEDQIEHELSDEVLIELRNTKTRSGNRSRPSEWGNVNVYTSRLNEKIGSFMENSEKKVLILNPDWHPVVKALSNFNIEEVIDLTVAEKTRIISERLFKYAMDQGETCNARYLIVYEEAHSLIPEWNSVANEGDRNATNGTAKVILQGRKYGLGCLVITQRTANVSKSILNQCNTIFALRVFDDTGKSFLQNYIGQDYTNVLPVLEERHAIAIGRGLKLKQPVIIRLNDREYFAHDVQ